MRTELQKLKETITEVLRLTKVNPNTKVEIKTEVAGLDWQLTRLERSFKEMEGEVAEMCGNKKKKSKESSVCTTSEGTQTFASMAPTSIDIGIQTNLEEEFSEEQRVARIEKSMNEEANASAEDIMAVISEDLPEALFRRTIRKEGSPFSSGSDVAVAITSDAGDARGIEKLKELYPELPSSPVSGNETAGVGTVYVRVQHDNEEGERVSTERRAHKLILGKGEEPDAVKFLSAMRLLTEKMEKDERSSVNVWAPTALGMEVARKLSELAVRGRSLTVTLFGEKESERRPAVKNGVVVLSKAKDKSFTDMVRGLRTGLGERKDFLMAAFNISAGRIRTVAKFLESGQMPKEKRGGDRVSRKSAEKRAKVKEFIASLPASETHFI
uniref:Uncharacterized protein LOC114331486 n=1 Tax=Diabrotica virgifera virgifera TaxID=50390 RepID=A0A6P7FL18_DIAVI